LEVPYPASVPEYAPVDWFPRIRPAGRISAAFRYLYSFGKSCQEILFRPGMFKAVAFQDYDMQSETIQKGHNFLHLDGKMLDL
jgi:hypothetical protein